MYKKIDVYINGVYKFSTNKYKTCKEVVNHVRGVKHIGIASVPNDIYLTVYDYDKIVARYSK